MKYNLYLIVKNNEEILFSSDSKREILNKAQFYLNRDFSPDELEIRFNIQCDGGMYDTLDLDTQIPMTLKELRNRYGITQQQLAERSGIPLRSIQDIEADKVMHLNTTPINRFKAIADVFGLTLDELFNLIN